ncbi:MAG: TlpA disulfide reductase family protein, partial [Myxococcota bacterium]|nr:TlpA disulfide reductase family protein [Myxococcota bacterium]
MRTWLLMALLACNSPEIGPQEGRRAPDIQAASLSGEAVSLDAWRGAPVVVVFWASWCGPCRQEVPEIAALQEHYGDRIHLLGV